MARFVRCIDGHVFDQDVHDRCPVCGAVVDSPRPQSQPPAHEDQGSSRRTALPEKPKVSPRLIAGFGGGIGLIVAAVVVWQFAKRPQSAAQVQTASQTPAPQKVSSAQPENISQQERPKSQTSVENTAQQQGGAKVQASPVENSSSQSESAKWPTPSRLETQPPRDSVAVIPQADASDNAYSRSRAPPSSPAPASGITSSDADAAVDSLHRYAGIDGSLLTLVRFAIGEKLLLLGETQLGLDMLERVANEAPIAGAYLGSFYKIGGYGLPRDPTEAALWLGKADDEGNPLG